MAISPQKTETAGHFTVTTTHIIKPEDICNLMISFIESGDPVTRGWCEGVYLVTPGSFKRDTLTPAGDRIWYANAGLWAADDWKIRVLEDEDETGDPDQCKVHFVTRAGFQKGLELLASGEYAHHFADIIKGNDDASTADIVMQFVCFGKEVYA